MHEPHGPGGPMSAPYVVGQSLDRRAIAMTDERVTRYAHASGDHNPIHLDEDAALRAGLPGRIVHGMLTMGMFTTVASGWAGGATNVLAVSCRLRAGGGRGDRERSALGVVFAGRGSGSLLAGNRRARHRRGR